MVKVSFRGLCQLETSFQGLVRGQTQASMTEQDAEALAARLTRIWGVSSESTGWPIAKWRLRKGGLEFRMALTSDIYFFAFGTEKLNLSLDRRQVDTRSPRMRWHDGLKTGELRCDNTGHISFFYFRSDPAPLFEEFATQWMDFFRRNCWLSGCSIEASAHEKAEWMQGFSQEELKAWNLKV